MNDEEAEKVSSLEAYVLWLPEEGLRYVVRPRRARTAPSGDEESSEAEQAAGWRDREKVGFWMPRGVRQRLRVHAAVLDRDMSEVIAQAVTEYLDRLDAQRVEEGLPPIPLR